MGIPVLIGDLQFRTKSAAKDEIRRRISLYNFGDTVSFNDQIFFENLFKFHSEYVSKVGIGIESIQVEKDFNNNRCLFITRLDGSRIDISWVHCVHPAPNKNVISMAFRREIKDRIIKFKSENLKKGIRCPITGVLLNFDNSHVAYLEQSFELLLSIFLTELGKDLESIEISDPKPADMDHRAILKDSVLARRWSAYHLDNAKLQLISAEANLKRNKSIG